jgi:hypothetical protein
MYNFKTNKVEPFNEKRATEYMPQIEAARNMYDILVKHKGYTPIDALLQVLLKIGEKG